MTWNTLTRLFALTAGLLVASHATALEYPTRPIKIIIPFSAGTGVDVLARRVAERISSRLKTPIVLENREGAGGTIGAKAVAAAPADGYTLLFAASPPFAIGPAVQQNGAYRPMDDFVPVARVATTPMILVGSPKAPFATFHEMASYVKRHPAEVSFATVGIGTPSHLGAGLLEKNLDAKLQIVHYKSSAQSATDTIGGHVWLAMPSLPAAIGHLNSKQVQPLAIGSPKRSALYPDVPTFAEVLKKADVEATVWYGLLAPRGTEKDVVELLAAEVSAALPSLATFLRDAGMEPAYEGAAAFAVRVRRDVTQGNAQLKELGVSN